MRLTQEEFQELVERGFQKLPANVRDVLENMAILVEDWPRSEDQEAAGVGDEGAKQLFGLYTGVPLSEREGGLPPLPDTITLFQRPIESACSSRGEIVREIRITLLHEVGHYLGMNEEGLERLGYG